MPKMSVRHKAGGKSKTRTLLPRLTALVAFLALGCVASRTLPLATPGFEEWAQRVVRSSNGALRPFLSAAARRQVELPPPQSVDEDTDVGFGPLLDAFAEVDSAPRRIWPRRTHEVSVSVGGESKQIVYHCVIEWFRWRVADISERPGRGEPAAGQGPERMGWAGCCAAGSARPGRPSCCASGISG